MLFTVISTSSHDDRARVDRILDSYCNRVGAQAWTIICREEALAVIRHTLLEGAGKHTRVACLETKGFKIKSLVTRWIVGGGGWVLVDGQLRYVVRKFTRNRSALYCAADSLEPAMLKALCGFNEAAGRSHDSGKNTELFYAKVLDTDRYPHNGTSRIKLKDPFRHEMVSIAVLQWMRINPGCTFNEALQGSLALAQPAVLQWPLTVSAMMDWNIVAHHKLPATGLSLSGQMRDTDAALLMLDSAGVRNPQKALDETTSLVSQTREEDIAILCQLTLDAEAKFAASSAQALSAPRFIALLLRSSLILSDHYISGLKDGTEHRCSAFAARMGEILQASPFEKKGAVANPQQSLTGHLRAVGSGARSYLRHVLAPGAMRQWLPSLDVSRLAGKCGREGRFDWQGRGLDAVEAHLKSRRTRGPLFVAVISSTGSGKTTGCAALANLLGDGRFTTALNLRTLTLQTGDEYRSRLGLGSDEVAVLIGSSAHKQLHESARDEPDFTDQMDVDIEGGAARLPDFLAQHISGRNSQSYLSAPVLVTTVDNIIDAGDLRKKRWIPPVLRLADGCLVLDEVDQYDIADIPALCRMIFVVGLLGQSLVCSSATLYPAIATHLYEAFAAGHRERATLSSQVSPAVSPDFALISDEPNMMTVHAGSDDLSFNERYKGFCVDLDGCVRTRAANGELHKLSEVLPVWGSIENAYDQIAAHCLVMQGRHRIEHDGIGVSVGIVRFARVADVLRFSSRLVRRPTPGTRVVVVPYHSKLALAVRNFIERRLDSMLKRGSDPMAPVRVPEVQRELARCKANGINDLCIVIAASPVEEVGRDHDADWAIIEPSSSRSMIQCSGRVQRHRRISPTNPNIAILSAPIRSIENQNPINPVFTRPGFETRGGLFPRESIGTLAPWTDGGYIHAGPCLNPDEALYGKLSVLESVNISSDLDAYVTREFVNDVSAFFHEGHMQKHRFRDGPENTQYFVDPWGRSGAEGFDIYSPPKSKGQEPVLSSFAFAFEDIVSRSSLLFYFSLESLAEDLASELGERVDDDRSRRNFAQRFFTFQVRKANGVGVIKKIIFDPICGFNESALNIA